METYDLVIVGGGPGGLSAAVYAMRARMKTLLLERAGLGGQIATTDIIENYLGFPSLSGPALVAEFEKHAQAVETPVKYAMAHKITKEGNIFIIDLGDEKIAAKSVILSSGAEPKKAGVPGEAEFLGRGVSNCGTCDGPFYRNQDIAIVGGGDTATKEAIYLSKIARKVYLVHRRGQLRAEKVLQERALARPNVEFLWFHRPVEVLGDKSGVTGLVIEGIETKEKKTIDLMGVFVFVGVTPNTGFVDCAKDASGFIAVNEKMESSIPGLFAVGDCRVTPLRQVAVAVGDGAIAATMAEEYVSAMEGRLYAGKAGKE